MSATAGQSKPETDGRSSGDILNYRMPVESVAGSDQSDTGSGSRTDRCSAYYTLTGDKTGHCSGSRANARPDRGATHLGMLLEELFGPARLGVSARRSAQHVVVRIR